MLSDRLPVVSVIIPCFNAEKTLNMTLESVTNQTYSQFEIIATNDGSRDSTLEILKSYKEILGERFIIINQQNKGVSAARNIGIRKASGAYIAFIDSDDLWSNDKLSMQLLEFEKNDIGLCHTGGTNINYEGEYVKSFHASGEYGGMCFNKLLIRNGINTSTVMVRKEALDDVGGFDETLQTCEDWHLWTRLSEKYRFGVLDFPLVEYRVQGRNEHGSTKHSYIDKMREGFFKACQKNRELYGEKNPGCHRYIDISVFLGHIKYSDSYSYHKYYIESLKEIGMALKNMQWSKRGFYSISRAMFFLLSRFIKIGI